MIRVTVEYEGWDRINVDMSLEEWESMTWHEQRDALDPYDPMREAELYVSNVEELT